MKGKRLVRVLLALALCVGLLPVMASAADSYTYSDLTYTVSNGKITITDCATSATSVTIPSKINSYPVTSIGASAFYRCSSLTSVNIPEGVTEIGGFAFAYCSALQKIVVNNKNTAYQSIDGVLYSKDGKTLIAVPGGKSGTYTIVNGVTSIEKGALCGCSSLTGVSIPSSVTSIGSTAFGGCSSLSSLTIPASVKNIVENAFVGASSLERIIVDSNNKNYSSDSRGVLFNKDKTKLLAAPGAISESYTIPDSVAEIAFNAFRECNKLSSITIPDSVTKIGEQAFWECSKLSSVTIPDSVTSIGGSAFYFCADLVSVTLSKNLTRIQDSTFMNCHKLENITIPNGVTCIDMHAFFQCNLTSITVPSSVTQISYGAFGNCYKLTSIYFTGNAPSFAYDVFSYVTATAYYPSGNSTWTEEVRQNYGGTITWVPYAAGETPTEHTHSTTHTDAKPATCTEDGNVEYWYCSECEKYFSDENCETEITNVTVGADGHSATYHDAVAPTYDAPGNVEYWYCSVCKKYFSDATCTKELAEVTLPPKTPKVSAKHSEDGMLMISGILSENETTSNAVFLAVYQNGRMLCVKDISSLPQSGFQLSIDNMQDADTVKIFRLGSGMAPQFAAVSITVSQSIGR